MWPFTHESKPAKYLRAFIAGLALPGTLLPIVGFFSRVWGDGTCAMAFPYLLPLIWGVWNMLALAFFNTVLPKKNRWFVTGGILGLLVAGYGVFVAQVAGATGGMRYLIVIIGIIVYAILWRYVVRHLNHLVGLKKD